jgi:hypothetical protein
MIESAEKQQVDKLLNKLMEGTFVSGMIFGGIPQILRR